MVAAISLLLGCQPSSPAVSPVGTWKAEFWLDSVGPLDSIPTSHYLTGIVTIGDSGADSVYGWPDTTHKLPTWLGNYQLDFTPFFGRPIARDVSTTIFGSTGGYFATELSATLHSPDTLSLELIPRISHGGVSASGRFVGDTVTGDWYVRAYAGGASGHFRLTRTSTVSPQVLRDPPPPPPDTLALAARGTIFVRVQDRGSGRYLEIRHGLHTPTSWIYSYSTGTTPEGWGPSFWLPPGSYGVVIRDIPCGKEEQFLEEEIEHRFEAIAGETTFVTVSIILDSLILDQSYKNDRKRTCADLRKSESGG